MSTGDVWMIKRIPVNIHRYTCKQGLFNIWKKELSTKAWKQTMFVYYPINLVTAAQKCSKLLNFFIPVFAMALSLF